VWLCQKVQYTSAAPFLNVRLNDWLKFLQYLCTLQIQLIFAIYMMNYLCTGQKRMGKILQLNFNIFRTRYIMLTTMLRKILMIKELYKTETMCFCQSIFIQLVHVFNQMFVNETNWQRFKRKYECTYIWSKHKLLIDNFNLLLSPICLNSYWAISFILNHLWVSFFVTCRQNLFDFAGFTGLATLVSVVYVPV